MFNWLKNLFVKKFTIRIIYRNGVTMDFRCTEFKIERSGNGNGISRADWVSVGHSRPVFLNVDEIVSIWQVK